MRHTLLTLSLSVITLSANAQLMINEVMQSNIDCIMDDRNDFPDSWIELYNGGTSPVNLSSYTLSTDSLGTDAWQLPSQNVGPRGLVLIYADKVNEGLHAPFRLDTGKDCHLWLRKTDGTTADHLHIKHKQPAPNIAYGRETNGAESWGYQYEPTPMKANCGRICSDILGEPVFSTPGQVLTSAKLISLTLSLPEGSPEGAEIRYTFDGSEPTPTSSLYKQPFQITNTRTIRAKVFCDGYLSPRSTTQSYLYLGRQMTLPVVSITTNNEHFYDSRKGIYNNPKKDWRRPINFEYFEQPESESLLNQLCETRIQGGASRDAQCKSLALYAHKRFGEKRFDHEFFPDQRPGQTDYQSILMRNAGNDFDYLFMRDAIIQRTMASHVDIDWQAWRPVIIFINGTYKGMLNIRERSNAHNIYTNYDHLEDIDMVENWKELKEGTMDNFNAFTEFYNQHGHTWEEYDELLDLNEYLNIMVMNVYYNNLDFPGNNIMMWRPREEGGRWRIIAKDVDYTMGLYNDPYTYQYLNWLNDYNFDPNHSWANKSNHTRLFRRLLRDEHFEREFIDRLSIYMGTFMNYDGTWAVWEPMYNLIKDEYPNHRRLINQWWPNYADEISRAKNWVRNRTSNLYQQVGNFFNIGSPKVLRINKQLSDVELSDISIKFNGIELCDAVFDGKFFANREITLEGGPALDADGTPLSNHTVTGWTVYYNGQNFTYDGPVCQFTMPNASNVIITACLGEESGIETTLADTPQHASQYYDLMGRPMSKPHGLVIERRQK